MSEIKNFPLSEHFSFFELSGTTHTDLLEENRQLAYECSNIRRLYCLANTVLEPLRLAYGSSIKVNSGFRSANLNKRVGGSSSSQHAVGEAADITTGNALENKALWELALKLGLAGDIRFGQLILEEPSGSSWVHISLGKPFRTAEGQVMKFNGHDYTTVRTVSWAGK